MATICNPGQINIPYIDKCIYKETAIVGGVAVVIILALLLRK